MDVGRLLGLNGSSFRSVANRVPIHFLLSDCYLMQTTQCNLIRLHFTEDKRTDSKQSDKSLVPKHVELFREEGKAAEGSAREEATLQGF